MSPLSPIAISAAFGFLKGLFAKSDPRVGVSSMHANIAGPLYEEVFYRAVPLYVGGDRIPRGFTALHFATDHVVSEGRHGLHGPMLAARFADVFAGGLLYEKSFRAYGLLGSFVAHAAHNISVGLGYQAAQRARGLR